VNYLQEHAGGEIVRGVGSIKLSGKIVEPKDGKGYKDYSSKERCNNLMSHGACEVKELNGVEREDQDTNIYNDIDDNDEIPKGREIHTSILYKHPRMWQTTLECKAKD